MRQNLLQDLLIGDMLLQGLWPTLKHIPDSRVSEICIDRLGTTMRFMNRRTLSTKKAPAGPTGF